MIRKFKTMEFFSTSAAAKKYVLPVTSTTIFSPLPKTTPTESSFHDRRLSNKKFFLCDKKEGGLLHHQILLCCCPNHQQYRYAKQASAHCHRHKRTIRRLYRQLDQEINNDSNRACRQFSRQFQNLRKGGNQMAGNREVGASLIHKNYHQTTGRGSQPPPPQPYYSQTNTAGPQHHKNTAEAFESANRVARAMFGRAESRRNMEKTMSKRWRHHDKAMQRQQIVKNYRDY